MQCDKSQMQNGPHTCLLSLSKQKGVKSILAEMWSFIKRHRNKFYLAGAMGALAASGGYLILSYVTSQAKEQDNNRVRNLLEKTRRNHHFESAVRTGSVTLRETLFPSIMSVVNEKHGTDELVQKLKEPGLTRDQKVDLWQSLIKSSLTECITVLTGASVMTVILRVQLSIIAGHMYAANGNNPGRIPEKLQEIYLCNVGQMFVTQRLLKTAETVREYINGLTANLQTELDRDQLLAVLSRYEPVSDVCQDLELIRNEFQEDNTLDLDEKALLCQLMDETLDVFGTNETSTVFRNCSYLLQQRLANEVFDEKRQLAIVKIVPIIKQLLRHDLIETLVDDSTAIDFSADVFETFSVL